MSGSKDRRWSGRWPGRGTGPGGDANGGGGDRENGPDGPMNDLTGNGIVNNGPENGTSGLGRRFGRDGGAGKGAGHEGAPGSSPAPDGGRRPGGDAGLGDRLRGDLDGRRAADVSQEPDVDPAGEVDGGLPSGGSGGTGGEPAEPAGEQGADLDGDELALRRLLHGAVQGLEPTEGALDHLRQAVPTRRARKRQALVGIAAAALLFGTAVPAFVHVANSGGTSGERSISAGHAQSSLHSADAGPDAEKSGKGGHDPSGTATPGEDAPGPKVPPGRTATDSPGGASPGASDAQSPPGPPSPVCDGSQLGVTAETGAPEADGTVYGTFHVANVSGRECSVSGSASIAFQTGGAADAAKITVVAHTAGDAASGLPDPSHETTALRLAPDAAYEVKFAWVPSDTCPTPTPSDPPPSPGGPPEDGTGSPESSDSTNEETQLLQGDDEPEDGSVSVSHTAEPGGPSAKTVISDACAGTIYRTGVLDAP